MHDNRFVRVYGEAKVVVARCEEVHALVHVRFGGDVESAVVRKQQIMDCGCGGARWGLHSTNVEEVSVRSVVNVDSGTLSRQHSVVRDARYHPVMELSDHVGEVLRTIKLLQNFPKSGVVHHVEGFCQVHERSEELTCGKYHVSGAAVTSKTTLAFRQEPLFQVIIQTTEENASEDFGGNIQQRDSVMVVTDLTIPFSLVEVDNCGVLEILRNMSLSPHLLEHGGEVRYELVATIFVDLRRDPVGPGNQLDQRFEDWVLLFSADVSDEGSTADIETSGE
ncbi:unnamed protein product [Dibothriocephalus latus]|uniref:Uncharacterized protein n=1 Tax=Dibothriocephalus latus TaxID=60516 RepID=A0A3P7PE12_DIBLA|nr:unnamed protein product [Dibothriocephalus latus]